MDSLISGSVTRHDAQPGGANGNGPMIGYPLLLGLPQSEVLPALPREWSWHKDWLLRESVKFEPMWAAAVGKAISKPGAAPWRVEDSNDSTRRTVRAQDMLLNFDWPYGWKKGIARNCRDFLTTSVGGVIEKVWRKGKVVGIFHLDALRCRLTGDGKYPIVYRDVLGNEHALRDYQVATIVDMPDSDAAHYGLGMCAAERAWGTIRLIAGGDLYATEKLLGNGATEIHFVTGIMPDTLQSIIKTADAAQQARGLLVYKGAIIATVIGDQPPGVASIPLKSAPDGFDIDKERRHAATVYGNALGIPVQEVAPLSGQGLGTGAQTRVLDEAAAGQGLAFYYSQIEHLITHEVLATSTTFYMTSDDVRDRKVNTEVAAAREVIRTSMIASGMITPANARQLAIDDGDLPREMFDEPDMTPEGTLADNQKPLEAADPVVVAVEAV